MKVIHSHHVSGKDVGTHHKKSNFPRDQQERQHVGGDNIHRLDLKVLMLCCPEQGDPPLLWTRCTRRDHVIPLNMLGVSIVGQLGLCQECAPMPIWRNPLATAAKPTLRPLLMFQVATKKVLLPPGRGGADKADIGISSLLINN